MLKKAVILVMLACILLALILVRFHTSAPANQTTIKLNNSSEYTLLEYQITNISDNQYYGKGKEGTQIVFSKEKIISDDGIQVNDVVICYFEKNNLGKGIVKVEKK
jgi:hypothetical protein